MASMRRFLDDPSCVFAWPRGSQPLQEARDRYTVAGAPAAELGSWGNAATFGGAADYITLGAHEGFKTRFDSATQDFSIAAWCRRGATGANQTLYSVEDGADDGWIFRFLSTDVAQIKVNAASAGSPAVADTDWHCVVGVVDRSASLLVYLDGVAGSGVAIAGPAMATTADPTIGVRLYDTSDYYDGAIAGVCVWNRVLSAAECLSLSGA